MQSWKAVGGNTLQKDCELAGLLLMGDVTAGHCGLVLDMVGASSPDSSHPVMAVTLCW